MPRFIVIGGGAIGLNTAYQLARKQAGSVILLEKGQVGDGSSSRAGGIITGLLWSETGVLARLISLRLYQELTADLERYGYRFPERRLPESLRPFVLAAAGRVATLI